MAQSALALRKLPAVPRRRSRSVLIAIACAGAGAGAVSCAAVLGFERLSTEDGFVLDGGADAGDGAPIQGGDAEAGSGDAGPCGELGIPAEPIDAAAGGGLPVIAAVKLLDFGVDLDGGAGDVPGFNLDRACSTDIATSTCTTNVLQPTFERHAKDKSAIGLDNASFSLIKYINSLSDILTAETLNTGIADGKYGAVVRLTDWNHGPDDNDVQLEIFPAIGLLPRAKADAGFGPDDRWILDSRFQVATTIEASSLKSDRAWVTGNRLVARFKEAYFPIKIDEDPKTFDIHITDAVVTATLATTSTAGGDATSLLAGTISGRWKTADFLGQVRTIFVKDANGLIDTVLCEPVPAAQLIYGSVKKEVCDARDIRSDSKDSEKLGCDAVSAAMRVEAYPVTTLGVFDAGPATGPRCTTAGSIPAGDDCTPN